MQWFLKWVAFGVCFALILTEVVFADPLETWSTWSTAQPYVSKQVPPNALVMRGIGTDAYYVVEVDPATGEIPVSLSGGSIAIDFSGPTGDPVPADAGFVGGVDGNGDLRGLAVDTSGQLQVDVLTGPDANFSGPTGSAVPADAAFFGGTDGTNLRGVKTDSSGELQVDVLSSALPTGAATLAEQQTQTTALTAIAADTTDIATDTGTIAGAVSGTEMQVDVVAALPAGTNNIGDVDVTNLPATVDTNAGAAGASTIRVSPASRAYADSVVNTYSSTNVTTASWVQLIASTAAAINLLCIQDTSGQILELGTGASSSETRVFVIPQGFSGCIPLRIAASTRLSVKAITATANTGYLVITGMN